MPRPIKIKIDVTKIDKAALYHGEKAIYLDAVAWPNKNGVGKFKDTHYLAQELSRERRDAGEKGAIIGNMTVPDEEQPRQETRPVRQQKMDQAFPPEVEEDDIPF